MTNTPVSTTAAAPAASSGTSWGWLLTGGICTMLIGVLMLVFPFASSISVTAFTGWALIAAGILGIITSFMSRDEGGIMWGAMALGLLAIVAGFWFAFNPLAGSLALTTMLTFWLIASGAVGLVMSLAHRHSSWMLGAFVGGLTLLLGLVLLASLPLTAAWVIGVYTGIALMFHGVTLAARAFDVKRSAAPTM